MPNTANTSEREVGRDASLRDRRLKSIEHGDLNWMGKGFLVVIKKDCENPKHSKDHQVALKIKTRL